MDVFAELEDSSYKIEELHQVNDEERTLRVSKTDIFTLEKLHKRNLDFNDLAVHCDVELYDGWNVGKVK